MTDDTFKRHGSAPPGDESTLTAAPGLVQAQLTARPGDRFGRYKILEEIGQGGCGAVFVAEQEEPVRRRVALKVIKLGMDTRQVIARFEAERQALAMMDHPNIARVLDAGATDTGRPFFVMELVRGIKITDYCDRNKLSTPDRLKLFIQVCQAVQHAHQKGIIHRDLKPSNILVTVQDGVPTPKVIDFGIAKATGNQKLTDKTVYTALEQFIGTPAYMSPEQAEMSGVDVDTRSDIYSLGVLLYELLVGETPFSSEELLGVGLDAMRRILREKDPARPSTKLSTMTKADLTAIALHRRSEPPKLIKLVRGDLDWIVLKCLEKDRSRRYETANDLATDIQRHLNNEPVVARPPSRLYELQKTVRRHWVGFAAMAAILVTLTMGVVVSALEAARAHKASERAVAGERLAQQAEAGEAKQKAAAQQLLYDSLVREARATRLARRVGYRNQVFALLRQAKALDVPEKSLTDLRREAVACLGDFIGLTPSVFTNFPTNLVQPARLDPPGKVALFSLADGTATLREVSSGKEIERLPGITGNPRLPSGDWSFNSNGDRLYCLGGSSNSRVCVWNLDATGHWQSTASFAMPGEAGPLLDNGKDMLTIVRTSNFTESGGSVRFRLFNLNQQTFVDGHDLSIALPKHNGWLLATPNGRLIAVETVEQDTYLSSATVLLYDWTKNQPINVLHLNLGGYAALNRDGTCLAFLSEDGGALYRLPDMAQITQFNGYFDSPPLFVGDRVAFSVKMQSRIRLWSMITREDVAMLQQPEGGQPVDASASGDSLLVTGPTHGSVYQLQTPERLDLPAHSGAVTGMAFSPDGARLASVSMDQVLRVSDAWTGRTIWQATNLPGHGQCVNYSPNGKWLVTGCGKTPLIWIWNAETGQRLLELGANTAGIVWSAQFSPDGRYLAAGIDFYAESKNAVSIWQVDDDNSDANSLRLHLMKSAPGIGLSLVFAPNSRSVAYAPSYNASNFVIWNCDGANQPDSVEGDFSQSVQCLSFMPDSRRILKIGNGQIAAFDAITRTKTSAFRPDGWQAMSGASSQIICPSPDGTHLAVSSSNGRGVDLVNPVTGRMISPLLEEYGAIYWLAWSPDSRRLAIARDDGNIAIWNFDAVEQVLCDLGLSQ